jgi:hypothetical protein
MRCSCCLSFRPPDELLVVMELATGLARYVCRVDVDPRCFRNGVEWRGVESIALALPGKERRP